MLKQVVDRLTSVPIVGVDLGSAVVKVVELARANGQLSLRRCAVAPVEGREPTSLLRQLLTEAGITTTHAVLGLAAPEVVVKPFGFPSMPRKELRNAIQLEAEQAILNGHAASDMAIDWHTLSSSAKDSIRGLLAVVPKNLLVTRMGIVRAVGLRTAIVDVEGLALWNAYWNLVGVQEPQRKTVFLINIGARTTNLVIATGPDALILVRDIQLGGHALASGQSQDWVGEIRDSLGYARAKTGLRTLDAVYVTGGGSGPTLIPLLKSAVSVPLTFWNPLGQLVRDPHGPSIEEPVGPLLAIAIGLALRQPT